MKTRSDSALKQVVEHRASKRKKTTHQPTITYSSVVQDAYERCGGKSAPKFGDIKEFAGHLAEILSADPVNLKPFLAVGRRRVAKKLRK